MTLGAFTHAARGWLAMAVVVTAGAYWLAPSHLGLALVAWTAVRALCVPQSRALVEAWMVAAAAVSIVRGPATGGVVFAIGLVVLTATLLRNRPEVATEPFVGFDLCHLLLTSPIRASTTHHFLELAAPLERASLTKALAMLIADVTRLRSFVREAPLGIQRFVAVRLWVDPAVLVDWHDTAVDPVTANWFERPIDVTSTPPVRLFHAPRADGGYLFGLTLHHSVADGTGAMVLLDGLLRRYDRLRGRDVHLPEILSRGPRYRRLVWRHGARGVFSMLAAALRHTTRGVQSAGLLDDAAPRSARFDLRLVDVPVSSWRAVVVAAGARGCTPNHFLMAASLRAADEVRRARGLRDETFRLAVPSDLRNLFDLPRSLPNYIGTVPLAVEAMEVREANLPSKVRDRVRVGRSADAQMCFPIQIGLVGLLPPAVGRRILRDFDRDPKTFAFSFLFSHIRVPRGLYMPAGNDVMRLWCASSQGRQPAFGVAITTIGDRTWALLQYLSPYVAHEAVEQFARALVAQLEALTPEASEEQVDARGAPCASA